MPRADDFEIDVVDAIPEGLRRVGWHPSIDIHEDAERVLVTVDLPGVDRKDIDIRLHDGVLTISGDRKLGASRRGFQRRERPRGTFARSFAVPGVIDMLRVSAALRSGVLTVTLPKRADQATKPFKVPIE
jgi:HSP20 family protein